MRVYWALTVAVALFFGQVASVAHCLCNLPLESTNACCSKPKQTECHCDGHNSQSACKTSITSVHSNDAKALTEATSKLDWPTDCFLFSINLRKEDSLTVIEPLYPPIPRIRLPDLSTQTLRAPPFWV